MAKFLIRDRGSKAGYKEVNPIGGVLPRTATESYVPWGLTLQQEVVYAKTGEHTSWNGGFGNFRLTKYNSIASQERRRICQSEFGVMALQRPEFTKTAVDIVSENMRKYLINQLFTNQDKTMNCVYNTIGHYFYTGGRESFGRINTNDKKRMRPRDVWDGILEKLRNGKVEQRLAIHDAVGRKVLPELGGNELVAYNQLGPTVRQDWFDDPDKRGRSDAPSRGTATNIGGIASTTQAGQVNTVFQSRVRGADSYIRDTGRTRTPEADSYYDELDVKNLLFGAGISGTTGTLLQAAVAFGRLDPENLKQYTMAIVGYLVGGGMHSYHETMAVAAKVGVPYQPGAYFSTNPRFNSLPQSFTSSPAFTLWNEKYYDIVTLGAIHWRYNTGVLPSHLNRELVTP